MQNKFYLILRIFISHFTAHLNIFVLIFFCICLYLNVCNFSLFLPVKNLYDIYA